MRAVSPRILEWPCKEALLHVAMTMPLPNEPQSLQKSNWTIPESLRPLCKSISSAMFPAAPMPVVAVSMSVLPAAKKRTSRQRVATSLRRLGLLVNSKRQAATSRTQSTSTTWHAFGCRRAPYDDKICKIPPSTRTPRYSGETAASLLTAARQRHWLCVIVEGLELVSLPMVDCSSDRIGWIPPFCTIVGSPSELQLQIRFAIAYA